MKRIAILYLLFAFLIHPAFSQSEKSSGFFSHTSVEVSGIIGLTRDAGFILAGKKELMHSNHFEVLGSLALQRTYWSETDKLLTGIDGFHRDIGAFTGIDLRYYPSSRKKLYLGTEAFVGITNLKSNGQLVLQEHSIINTYAKSYTFVNYGIAETIGYRFGRLSTGFFVRTSLKGYLDKGRTRTADYDSKLFIGLSLAYHISRHD